MAVHPFFDLQCGLPQNGPGSDASTARAFSKLGALAARPRILDMGCGVGRQTLALAQLAPDAAIEAVDVNPPFLEELARRAAQAGVAARITTQQASMLDPRFRDDPADLIWSEGAIYNVGLREGLEAWRGFLKPGGYVALTEIAWLVDPPPARPLQFWSDAYPAMQSSEANLSLIQALGWRVLDHFPLPESDWLGYYEPQDERYRLLCEKYAGDAEAIASIGSHDEELAIYREFSHSYSYVFYLLER